MATTAPNTRTPADAGDETNATDEAAALAKKEGVDLGDVKGTGSGGRVLVGDVEAYVDGRDDLRDELTVGDRVRIVKRSTVSGKPYKGATARASYDLRPTLVFTVAERSAEAPVSAIDLTIRADAAAALVARGDAEVVS